jgi:hypothetical protein
MVDFIAVKDRVSVQLRSECPACKGGGPRGLAINTDKGRLVMDQRTLPSAA